ncbi:MAG: hypothetical protein LBF33_01335 [Oscillospiraceae bacterium]|jgi:hypothetical protein|nr:hypothetical protein [Oscillospiraceae bacterium]
MYITEFVFHTEILAYTQKIGISSFLFALGGGTACDAEAGANDDAPSGGAVKAKSQNFKKENFFRKYNWLNKKTLRC